jgi:putative membrane protein
MQLHSIGKTAALVAILSLTTTAVYGKTLSAQDFVTKASTANMFEIESSKLAQDKAHRDDVKAFADRMVEDHTKTGDKLEEVLADSNQNIKPANALDNKHQKLMNKLKATSEDKFDAEYVKIQTDAHKEAVGLFSDYSKSGSNTALKDFATETLPTLQEHWDHVRELKSKQ